MMAAHKVEIKSENVDVLANNPQEVETKPTMIYKLTSLGKAIVDRRYTVQILQWVVREISQVKNSSQKIIVNLSLKHDGLKIETVEGLDEPLSKSYSYESILKLLRLKSEEKLLAFVSLGRTEHDSSCCHAFECEDNETKVDLLRNLKSRIMESQALASQDAPPKKKVLAVASVRANHKRNLSYGGPVPQTQDDAVHRYSVFYVGKVTISQAKAPPKFLDEMLKIITKRESDCEGKDKPKKNGKNKSVEKLVEDLRIASGATRCTAINQGKPNQGSAVEKRLRSASDGDERLPFGYLPDQKNGTTNGPHHHKKHNSSDNKLDELHDDISVRVVTFQISMSSLMLFSAGNKQLLLEKKIREISYCTKGQQRTDHFGFICREKNGHVLYLFQGESEYMVDTIMKAMKQAFTDALQASAHLNLCDTCPIQSLSKLLIKFEGATISEQQASLQEHLQNLNETEYSFIMNKYNAKPPDVDSDKIALVVYLLRAVYDQRQKIHQHNFQGMGVNAPSHQHCLEERERSRSTFFEKAKKSLTNSFDNLLMRRQRAKTCLPNDSLSVDTSVTSTLTADSKRCLSPNLPRSSSEDNVLERRRSRTFNSCPPTPEFQNQTKFVIPENEAESKSEFSNQNDEPEEKEEESTKTQFKKKNSFARQGSWRQHIYNTVTVDVTINDQEAKPDEKLDPSALAKARWQKAIQEQIILIRMEKENKNLAAKISATETRRQKLNYEVFHSCTAEAATVWDGLLAKNWKDRVDSNVLIAAVRAGVPKYRRGEVWRFLVQQHLIRAPKKDDNAWQTTNYHGLLEQSTSHQHAIFIDLNRTFPSHAYFNSQLGAGQICLFNILKSYSVLDSEVGYCQGLSFVAGLIIMHMSEQEAFGSFCYAMYSLGIRNQYKPDMNAVQQQLYQLSRLLHDCHPNIYEHFNVHDVTPTLYAAPWFLTLFASHYPIGFVVRVMDLVFLQGLEVIFKIGLVLFANNSAEILECDGFESIIEFMKTGLPEKVREQGEDLISQALDMDIKYQLNLFEVEYQLLHEEMIDIRQNRERYEKLEAANRALNQRVDDLTCELDYVKKNADMNAKRLASLNAVNEDLRSQYKELESENQTLRMNARLKNGGFESANGPVVSPASSEVDDIMHASLDKKDSVDGQVTMEKSWELVPSPTTVNLEMIDMVESFECNFSLSSLSGESPASDLSEGRKSRHAQLANSKSTSSDSCDSMDLISFDSNPPKTVISKYQSANSSLNDVLVDRKEAKPSSTKKRPALPLIKTTSLLETCKGEN